MQPAGANAAPGTILKHTPLCAANKRGVSSFLRAARTRGPQARENGLAATVKNALTATLFIERCQDPFLPDEILWRQKEQFSDGVGYGWIDHIKSTAEAAVSDVNFEARQHRFPHNTPHTKEAYVPLAGTTLCWAMGKYVECVCLGSGTGSLRRDGVAVTA